MLRSLLRSSKIFALALRGLKYSMNITEHIAVFPQALGADACQAIIDQYTRLSSLNLSYSRSAVLDAPAHRKADTTAFALEDTALIATPDLSYMNDFLGAFWRCWEQYCGVYSLLPETEPHRIRSMRIQRTQPGEGYHVWHYESDSRDRSTRIAAFGLYLNTVESGGETEWLYQHLRVPCTQGTLAIWPATYTHVHRGNPPLTGDKYLLTGWVEY